MNSSMGSGAMNSYNPQQQNDLYGMNGLEQSNANNPIQDFGGNSYQEPPMMQFNYEQQTSNQQPQQDSQTLLQLQIEQSLQQQDTGSSKPKKIRKPKEEKKSAAEQTPTNQDQDTTEFQQDGKKQKTRKKVTYKQIEKFAKELRQLQVGTSHQVKPWFNFDLSNDIVRVKPSSIVEQHFLINPVQPVPNNIPAEENVDYDRYRKFLRQNELQYQISEWGFEEEIYLERQKLNAYLAKPHNPKPIKKQKPSTNVTQLETATLQDKPRKRQKANKIPLMQETWKEGADDESKNDDERNYMLDPMTKITLPGKNLDLEAQARMQQKMMLKKHSLSERNLIKNQQEESPMSQQIVQKQQPKYQVLSFSPHDQKIYRKDEDNNLKQQVEILGSGHIASQELQRMPIQSMTYTDSVQPPTPVDTSIILKNRHDHSMNDSMQLIPNKYEQDIPILNFSSKQGSMLSNPTSVNPILAGKSIKHNSSQLLQNSSVIGSQNNNSFPQSLSSSYSHSGDSIDKIETMAVELHSHISTDNNAISDKHSFSQPSKKMRLFSKKNLNSDELSKLTPRDYYDDDNPSSRFMSSQVNSHFMGYKGKMKIPSIKFTDDEDNEDFEPYSGSQGADGDPTVVNNMSINSQGSMIHHQNHYDRNMSYQQIPELQSSQSQKLTSMDPAINTSRNIPSSSQNQNQFQMPYPVQYQQASQSIPQYTHITQQQFQLLTPQQQQAYLQQYKQYQQMHQAKKQQSYSQSGGMSAASEMNSSSQPLAKVSSYEQSSSNIMAQPDNMSSQLLMGSPHNLTLEGINANSSISNNSSSANLNQYSPQTSIVNKTLPITNSSDLLLDSSSPNQSYNLYGNQQQQFQQQPLISPNLTQQPMPLYNASSQQQPNIPNPGDPNYEQYQKYRSQQLWQKLLESGNNFYSLTPQEQQEVYKIYNQKKQQQIYNSQQRAGTQPQSMPPAQAQSASSQQQSSSGGHQFKQQRELMKQQYQQYQMMQQQKQSQGKYSTQQQQQYYNNYIQPSQQQQSSIDESFGDESSKNK